jgi:protein phosphatase
MEDAHCVELTLPKHQDYAFFGIFDGHSGSLCANFMAETLYKNIDSVEDFSDLEALGKTCILTDEQFLSAYVFLLLNIAQFFHITSYEEVGL